MTKKTLRVLLVDDDEDEYILIKSMFARLPGMGNGQRFVLDWVPNYAQALDACINKGYDVHLVDYYLGRYNGLDLMRAAEENGCSAPFIILTGQGSYELDLAAMEQGASDYLSKDQINENLLERSIRYALERKQAQDELEDRVRERTRELAEANEILQSEIERRTRAENTLRESEARFRTLAETTSAAIFIVQNQVIRYANPAARFVTGYPVEELVGKELWKLAHPAYQAPLRSQKMVTNWAEKIPARYEIKILTRQGEERWVDLTAGAMEFEQREAWLLTAFDITERDRAEQALRRARDELEQRVIDRTAEIQATSSRLQTVLRTLPVPYAIADMQGSIVETNASYLELWDIEGALPPQRSDWGSFRAWFSDTGEELKLTDWPLERAVLYGESFHNVMIDLLTAAGRNKTMLNSAVPILDGDGRIVGGLSVSQDITVQRVLEQQAQAAARDALQAEAKAQTAARDALQAEAKAQAAARDAQQRAEELDGLHRATAALLSTLDLDELLGQILDAAQSAITAAERGMLHLVSPTTGRLQVRATLGLSDDRIRIIHSPNRQAYPDRVVRERRPLLIQDTLHNDLPNDLRDDQPGIRSIIIAPLSVGEQVLGTLSLSSTVPGAFTESNLHLLVSFAATTTAALQNAMLHSEVKQLATLDPLTGLYNRRAFFDLGQREVERFQRFNHPLSVVMIDLDNFKEVNDTLGHAAGDQVLRLLAERVRATIRETDIFGRYGGDEFALLLPDTDLPSAMHIAGRIRDSFSLLPWSIETGAALVAASLGVAQANKRHQRLEDLLADADRALYQAKSAGRNRVELFTQDDKA